MSETTTGGAPESAANPGTELAANIPDTAGLPPHRPRQTDIDPKAARRAERQVSLMFLGSALMTVLFVIAFLQIPVEQEVNLPFSSATINASNAALGITFGLAIFLIGAGAIHWAKKLMPDEEVVQMRHDLASTPKDRAEANEVFWEGADESGFPQRKMIRRTLLLAMALFPLPLVFMLRDLDPGPLDINALRKTLWRKNELIVTEPTGRPLKPEDIPIGGMVSAMPENLWLISPEGEEADPEGHDRAVSEAKDIFGDTTFLNELAKAAIILVRMTPEQIVSQQGDGWDHEGILAYSKICTHVGCPIALYQQRTHHLLCPCHQSTFDLADSGNVVFGPAARALPQLPITVNEEGFLVAKEGFDQPVGPSFWERDR
jgi:ubiquinol-cytochrome c reductase iron-sulfur subunit